VIERDIYEELEAPLLPMVRSLSVRFAGTLGIGHDDAFQEARMALWEAFQGYDYNKSRGGVFRFARAAVHNAFCALLYKATTQTRTPHTVYEDETGRTHVAKHRLASLDDISLGSTPQVYPSPEQGAQTQEIGARVRVLRMRLYRSLTERERKIFRCKAQPSERFMLFLRNVGGSGLTRRKFVVPGRYASASKRPREVGQMSAEPTNPQIAKFLGITKNAVDWSLHRIRRRFVELAELPEFSGLVEEIVEEGSWPMIHISEKPDDVEFVLETIAARGLDPRPIPGRRDIQVAEGCGRIVETYHWGAVIHLQYGDERRTIVVEGRFNKLTGEVHAEFGNWKSLAEDVPWYRRLNRELSRS
jgi:RNA polymerase sigma factor (sigma-70 family)